MCLQCCFYIVFMANKIWWWWCVYKTRSYHLMVCYLALPERSSIDMVLSCPAWHNTVSGSVSVLCRLRQILPSLTSLPPPSLGPGFFSWLLDISNQIFLNWWNFAAVHLNVMFSVDFIISAHIDGLELALEALLELIEADQQKISRPPKGWVDCHLPWTT